LEPRPASTTVLVRPGDSGAELLFVRRPDSMRFLGGFHAFPGGSLDPEDSSERAAALSRLSPEEAGEAIGDAAGDIPAIAFYVCALRELFEEVGLLYAYRSGAFAALQGEEVDVARSRLLSGEESFVQIAERLGVELATDRLRFLVRWLAPEALPIRFDARVFVALAAGDPQPDPGEVVAVDWFAPSQAMALAESGALMLAPPTVATVSMLARYSSVDEMLVGSNEASETRPRRHSPLVRRLVAPNASVMTGPGSNTYLVGTNDLIVIDPASMERGHLEAIAGAGPVREIVVTHGHPDHFSGALELAEATGAALAASHHFAKGASPELFGRRLADGDTVEVDSARLVVMETPGHASDHICLWLEQERALFSGDLILGEGTTVISPPDGNLADYLSSLEKVARLDAVRLYPGHFDPRDDAGEWIAWYISHRIERETQVLRALKSGAATIRHIVERVYEGYPPALHPVAERSVLAHLEKLEHEGRVTRDEDRWSTVAG